MDRDEVRFLAESHSGQEWRFALAQTSSDRVFVTDASEWGMGAQGLSPSLLGRDMHQFCPPEVQLEHHNLQEGAAPVEHLNLVHEEEWVPHGTATTPQFFEALTDNDHVDVPQIEDEVFAAGEALSPVDPSLASARLDDHSTARGEADDGHGFLGRRLWSEVLSVARAGDPEFVAEHGRDVPRLSSVDSALGPVRDLHGQKVQPLGIGGPGHPRAQGSLARCLPPAAAVEPGAEPPSSGRSGSCTPFRPTGS